MFDYYFEWLLDLLICALDGVGGLVVGGCLFGFSFVLCSVNCWLCLGDALRWLLFFVVVRVIS